MIMLCIVQSLSFIIYLALNLFVELKNNIFKIEKYTIT